MPMKKFLTIFFLFLVVGACSRSYEVFSSKYPVSFSCDINKSPFNKMQTSGYFLVVRSTATKDGYKVKEPDGREQTFLYTEVQNRMFRFGLAGLIIGKPYFGDGLIYAYDLGCPQCDRASVYMDVNEGGIATCNKCHTDYDLNNGGIAKTGVSRPLYRYRIALNGNIVMIHN